MHSCHLFILNQGYSLTGHRSQGATITDDVIIHVRNVFAPGWVQWSHMLHIISLAMFFIFASLVMRRLLYVMLSRVKTRKQLHIVGRLEASMFKPIVMPPG